MDTALIRELAANAGLMVSVVLIHSLLRTDLPRRWSVPQVRAS